VLPVGNSPVWSVAGPASDLIDCSREPLSIAADPHVSQLAVGVAGVGAGIFFMGIAAVLHTSWYFITIARTLDAQLAREFGVTRKAIDQFHGRLVQSEGSFTPFDEKTAAMHEELDKLKAESPSMSDDEYKDLKEKIETMGVGADV